MMFEREEQEKRIGELEFSDIMAPLMEVEDCFRDMMKGYPTEYTHDCTAMENPYFKTMGYTNYSDCFLMYPLQYEMSYRQVMKAVGVGVERDFCGYFEDKVLKGVANKYKDRKPAEGHVKTLVVMPGNNKIVDTLSLEKVVWILDNYPKVGLKPHPLTDNEILRQLEQKIGKANVLPMDSDLYGYMINCDTVFSTHLSESAAYGVALGKSVYPCDKYNTRLQQSFSHINGPMFLEQNPRSWINRTFSDYRSGVLNPALEKNWEEKMKRYLDFIHDEREMFLNAYM